MRDYNAGYFVKLIALFVMYYFSARFGLRVDAVSGFATLVWLPTGISLAFLLLFGMRFWPAITLGAFLANLNTGAPFIAALGIGVGNTLEAIVATYLLKRVAKFEAELNRVNDVIFLVILAAGFSTAISATIGVTSLLLTNVIDTSHYSATWTAWWGGDMISDLVIAPFILVWATRPWLNRDIKYWGEFISLLLITAFICLTIFGTPNDMANASVFRTYLVFPPLIWLALRMGPREAVTGVLLVTSITTWGTAKGYGPFAVDTVSNSLRYLQGFMAVVSVTTMLLVAAICERKKLESKKDEFISIAGHELKTPLTSIKALSQALQLRFERQGDMQSSGYLNRVNMQINKLTRLVVELLDVTKMNEGKLILRKEKFDMRKLIDEIVEDMVETSNRNIIIKGRANSAVVADKDRVAQIITNLLANAIRHSSENENIIIKIAKKPRFLNVSVQDFGDGITKSEQSRIFERFYQIENPKRNNSGSMGLGLYIAKEIVDGHGGQIWVDSQKDKGSTFSFSLPSKV